MYAVLQMNVIVQMSAYYALTHGFAHFRLIDINCASQQACSYFNNCIILCTSRLLLCTVYIYRDDHTRFTCEKSVLDV